MIITKKALTKAGLPLVTLLVSLTTTIQSFGYDVTITPLPAGVDECHDAFSGAGITDDGNIVTYQPYFFDANNVGCQIITVPRPYYLYDVPSAQGARYAPTVDYPYLSVTGVQPQLSGSNIALIGSETEPQGSPIDSGVYLQDRTTQIISKLSAPIGRLTGWDIGQTRLLFSSRLAGQFSSPVFDDHILDVNSGVTVTRRRPLEGPVVANSLIKSTDGEFDIISVSNTLLKRDLVSGELHEIQVPTVNGLTASSRRARRLSANKSTLVFSAWYDLPGADQPVEYLFYANLVTGDTTRIPNSESCPADLSRPELPQGNFCGAKPYVSGNGRFVVFIQAESKVGSNPVNPPISGTVHPRGLAIYDHATQSTEMLVEETCTAYWDDDSLPTFCARAGFVADSSFDGLTMVMIDGLTSRTSNANYGTVPSLLEIVPNDPVTPEVRLVTASVRESDAQSNIALSLTRAVAGPVTVTIESADGEATAIDDYVSVNQTVSFAPGELYAVVPIALVDDQVNEASERFFVKITNVTGAQVGDDTATIVIEDDDSLRTVSIDDLTVIESQTDLRPFESLRLRLSEPSDDTVNAEIRINEETANSFDYRYLRRSIEFAPGQVVTTVPLQIIDDAVVESTETLQVEIVAVSSGTEIGDATATVTINDDDTPANGQVRLRLGGSFANESEAPYNAEVTALLNQAATVPVTATVKTLAGTATDGADYVGFSQTIMFAPGETFKTIPLAILDDNLIEGDETLAVELTGVTGADAPDIYNKITIRDGNEDPSRRWVKFAPDTIGTNVVGEGDGSANVVLQLFGANDTPVEVIVKSRGVSATADEDFGSITQTVTFLPSERTKTVNVPIIEDQIDEQGESFVLEITDVTGAQIRDRDDAATLVVILDNDEPTVVPDVSISDETFAENDGVVQIPLQLSQASAQPVTVSVFTRNISAQGGQDFYGFTQTVTFAAGVTNASVNLTLLDDVVPEATETLELRLFNASGASIADGVGIVTIEDNDTTVIPDISIADAAVNEGDGVVQIPLALSQASTQPVSVSVFTRSVEAQGGQDYYGFTQAVTIPAGTTTGFVNLTLLDDTLSEGTETLELRLFGVTGATYADRIGVVTITDNDSAITPELSIADTTVNEADGTVQVMLNLSQATSQTVSVYVFTRSIEAQGGQDFYGFTRKVTFAAGTTSASVDLTVLNDTVPESTEVLELRLFGASGATMVDRVATVTIIDDD